MDKIKAILFGLTGQGNSAFNVLLRHPIFNLVGVFTRKKFDAPYPYYSRKQLNQIVEETDLKDVKNSITDITNIKKELDIKSNLKNEINTIKETVTSVEKDFSDINNLKEK